MSTDMHTLRESNSMRTSKSKHNMRKSKKKNKMSIEQQIQFDRVKEIKVEWTNEQTKKFCEENNWEEDSISAAITSMFECK